MRRIPRPSEQKPEQPSGRQPGTLYLVATPIGNLQDITLRALETLRRVDLIAAEDTRHTRKLLTHHGLSKPLVSYHEHIEARRAAQLVTMLQEGREIALVADAGTPGIADPGYRVVSAAAAAGIRIVPIPGPSALLAALAASGLPTHRFLFEGFLPVKPGARRRRLEALRQVPATLIFYESPHRMARCAVDLAAALGARRVVMARELTKLHEEFWRGLLPELAAEAARRAWRGEITLVVEGATRDAKGGVAGAADEATAEE